MDRRAQTALFWGILVLAAGLRLFRLGEQSFWIDEVFQMIDSSRPVGTVLEPYLRLDLAGISKSPLTFVLHHFVLQIGGGEFFLRLPSALFSVAEVAVLFFLARALLGYRTGALAAFLLAISPLHIWYAQEFRYYSLWTLLMTGSFLALVVAWQGGTLRSWVAYVGTMIAGAATFVVTVFVLALQWLSGALLWHRKETPGSFRRGFGVVQCAALLIVAIPVLIRQLRGSSVVVGTPRDLELLALPYTFFTFVAGFSAGPSVRELHFSPGPRDILLGHPEVLLFLAVFGPLAVLGLWRLMARTPAREFLLPWAFGPPLLVFMATAILGNTYNVRYALPALTAFTAVLAVGIQAIASARLRQVAAGAVVLCMGFALANYYFNSTYHKADVRSAVQHVRAGDLGEAPLAVTGQILPAVGYYGGGELEPFGLSNCEAPRDGVMVAAWQPNQKTFPSTLVPREEFEQLSELWLMSGRDWERRGDACLEWLESTHRIAERHDFAGVDLFRLTRREELSPARP